MLFAATVEAQPQGPVATTFAVETVADGIYAFVSPEPKTGFVQGNCVAVVGQDGVLVVDSGQYPALTRRMIGEIRKQTTAPVRFLVNTHWHGDHLLGNGQYREAFPGIAIVGHTVTRQLMEKFYSDVGAAAVAKEREFLAQERSELEQGRRKDGTPLSDEDKEYIRAELADGEQDLATAGEIRYAAADLTFENELTLHLGGRDVKLLHLGRGNTGGDTVVFVPDAQVAIAGDLVVYPTPYALGSFLGEWVETLRKLKALGAATLVPGHGPVMRSYEYVDSLIALIESVLSQVRQAVKEGKSLEETRASVDVESFRRTLTGEDLWRRRAFEAYFVRPAVGRAYKEARGENLDGS
jgi:glyoxylase-like metal-dependent hydrolase (beta-lactamase superfamily II)